MLKSKLQKDKSCMVCGDKALGFNFNAVTCESCKAFFRRNACRDKRLSCQFSFSCQINSKTRRFCQRCRLDKCFKIGMKKEFIMSEEDKEIKRKKIEQNRSLKKSKGIDSNDNNNNNPTKNDKSSVKLSQMSPTPSIADSTMMELEDCEISEEFKSVTSESTVEQIVEAITTETKNSTRIIQKIMTSQTEAVDIMSRIIQEPSHALKLIAHLIKIPSDGMMIISKMMNSPMDALEVFTKFMSTPTDALQIIFKIMSSPNEVLQFMSELSKTPNDGLEILRRFMSAPVDTLNGITKIMLSTALKTEDNSFPSIDSPAGSYQESINSPKMNNSDTEIFADNGEQMFNEISNRDFKNTSITSIINQAIKLEYESFERESKENEDTRTRLNEAEIFKIQELIDSNIALSQPIDDEKSLFVGNLPINADTVSSLNPVLMEVINLTSVAIRRLIKMSKKISGFKKLCQEDQIALLKGGCTEMMMLRSVMQYDSRQEVWKVPSTSNSAEIKAEILKLCPKGNIYEEHENFIKTFDLKLRSDENIILILCAITLFSPERQYVIHPDVIHLEQSSYYYLLRRYLESIFSGCEAKSAYLKLLQKLQEMKKLNEDVISVYLGVDPCQVEPLLREIFDLKV